MKYIYSKYQQDIPVPFSLSMDPKCPPNNSVNFTWMVHIPERWPRSSLLFFTGMPTLKKICVNILKNKKTWKMWLKNTCNSCDGSFDVFWRFFLVFFVFSVEWKFRPKVQSSWRWKKSTPRQLSWQNLEKTCRTNCWPLKGKFMGKTLQIINPIYTPKISRG